MAVAPPHSTITVAVQRGDHSHRLSVADHGAGLTDADKERATRRFWRGNTTTAGTGLGLAIASSLAEGCGAGLQLEDTAGGGLTVAINFPSLTTQIGHPFEANPPAGPARQINSVSPSRKAKASCPARFSTVVSARRWLTIWRSSR